MCNSVGWKVFWFIKYVVEEGSICGCFGDRFDRCRVIFGCFYIKIIGFLDFYFYNVLVCYFVEIIGKSICLLIIKVIILNFIVKFLDLNWISGFIKIWKFDRIVV